MDTTAILAERLTKRFGDHPALDGFDLTAKAGTVCALLGPNGAGKTTAVRILTTLLRFDAGRAEVAGHDVRTEPAAVRARTGLVGQHAAVDEILSARQNLVMFGRLYHLSPARARARADELLDQFALTDAADRPVEQFSGGMRRRLDLAAGLVLDPPVLFLDEPTTGLDPRGRAEVWQATRRLVEQGTTVLLTTQYLEEADQLADDVVVLDRGRVVATGSPAELKQRLGGDRLELVVHDAADLAAAATIAGPDAQVDEDRRLVSAPVDDRIAQLTSAVRALAEAGIEVEDIALRRPTLDEVFLELTADAEQVPA